MFPGVNGFHWAAGHLIFLGIFFSVLLIVGTTVLTALLRSRRDMKLGKANSIGWHERFEDLPVSDRLCRHQLTGEFMGRVCDNAFDCGACATHPKLQQHEPAAGREDVLGLPVPLDRYYHRGHTWVQPEADGTLLVGLDELAARVVGEPDRVDLPASGARVEENSPVIRLTRMGVSANVLAPVAGTVVETGGPDRPFYLRIRPEPGKADLKHLLRGKEVVAWMRRELDRLYVSLSPVALGPSLADGGEPVGDMMAAYPQADWDGICGRLFLEP